ncbi:MAG TPA: hypothetical protein VM264_09605 [Acidimicrobiales bacterium]|nr:hypothetical protein [Acidimicrobiales bacterium]
MSALPSGRARGLAFAAIVVAGVCGGLIGSAFVELQCERGCSGRAGLGGLIGALLGAGGVAVVAVLVLRAMGEWQRIAAEQAAELGEDAEGDEPDGDEGVPKDL